MKAIKISETVELLFVQVTEDSINIRIRDNVLEMKRPFSTYSEVFQDVAKYTILGEVTKNGEINEPLLQWGFKSCITKDILFGLMVCNGIYLANPMGETKPTTTFHDKLLTAIKANQWLSFEKNRLQDGNKYLVLSKESQLD